MKIYVNSPFLIDKEILGGHDGQQYKPWIFHFNNLLLHLFCVFMVYRIMLLLNLSREAAIVAALLFGIHPMRVESVAWVTVLAIDYYFKRPLDFNGLAGIYFLSAEGSINVNEEVTSYGIHDRLAVGAFSYCIYLIKFVFPYEMSPLYPYVSKLTWYYWACLAAIPVIGFFLFKAFQQKRHAIIFAFAFFTFNVMFLLQILGAGQGLKADRFTYIPYMGLFFLVAWGYDTWRKKNPGHTMFLNVGLGAYLLIFAGMTYNQSKIWENGGTLWTHVLKYYDRSTLPWGNRARYYRENEKNNAKAEADYKKAISIQPTGELHNSLGKTYFDNNQTDLAITEYSKAIDMKKTEAEFFVNRGAAYGAKGNLQAALQDLNEGIKVEPDFANAYLNRSLVFTSLQQYDKALLDHDSYLNLKPFNADIWYEKGITHYRLGNSQDALKNIDRAIQLKNTQPIFFMERGKIHLNNGNKAQAKQDFQRAQGLGYKVDPAMLQQVR